MTTYSEQNRDWHYLATVDKSDCPLCLLGMGSSHGQGRDEETRARLGDRWWAADRLEGAKHAAADGALDESKELYSQSEIDELVATLDRLASDGKPTELYLLRHDHAPLGPDDEDVCVQYLTDHHPFKSWNVSADEEL